MTRAEAIKKIESAINKKYGRATLKSVCEAEGWNLTNVSNRLSKNDDRPIMKNLLDFAGLECTKTTTYRRKEK